MVGLKKRMNLGAGNKAQSESRSMSNLLRLSILVGAPTEKSLGISEQVEFYELSFNHNIPANVVDGWNFGLTASFSGKRITVNASVSLVSRRSRTHSI